MTRQARSEREQRRGGVLASGRAGRWWLLALALACELGAGLAYGWEWRAGVRGVELLGFTAKWLCGPFALGLLLLFAYFRPPARRAG
jgi:hypothetical protein